jgi:uncharacterized membrane protein SpoIIM required for sporulation
VEYFARGFLITIIVSLVAVLGSALICVNYALLTATPTQAQQAKQQITSTRQNATWQGIFLNNLRASWFLIIPVYGPVLFFIIWCRTAAILGFEAAYYHAGIVSTSIFVLLIIGLGALETSAYIFACSESLYITYLVVRRLGAWERIKKQSWKTFALYATLLLIAAMVETLLIRVGL